ncbi:MAG: hypothetical protein OQK82_04290 [Candidatus Pacearchaeota archaeon]|nr:hypothetical protein [Candidatus Pacearchaeota archaeon]
MTTVFGLRHDKVDSAVLVADRQATFMDLRTGVPQSKYLGRKLWKSKDDNYCFGHTGLMDEQANDFVNELIDGKFDMEKIIKEQYFEELRNLNISRMGKEVPELQNISGFLLATRFDKNPKLYTCFPLGSVQERSWTCAGSGDKKIIEYMNALQIMSEAQDYMKEKGEFDIRGVIRVGLEAVRRAQGQDMYSSGLDMMVCTQKKIIDHYSELGDDFGKKLRKIQNQYKNSK